jgi:hypothetical protein
VREDVDGGLVDGPVVGGGFLFRRRGSIDGCRREALSIFLIKEAVLGFFSRQDGVLLDAGPL